MGKNIQEILSERLKRLSELEKLSITDLAKAGEIDPKTLKNILAGSSSPKPKHLRAWAENLDLNLNWLVLGEGEMRRSAAYRRDNGMLVGEVSKAAPHLGPVAERVDGIERAAPGTPLVDMLPFVIKNLRSWYHTVSAAMPESRANEPEGPTYAQENTEPKRPPGRMEDNHTKG
jgi:transcriptional regulator with XRE-family HTH domain